MKSLTLLDVLGTVLAGLLLLGAAATAPAQVVTEPTVQRDGARGTGPEACPRGEIAFIFIDNHGVFDTDEVTAERRFAWAYDLANSLHMRTDRSFIESELLFREGECYDPFLLEESERLLRAYRFIAQVDVYGVEQADGSWHVIVDTTDEWTTEVNFRVSLAEGFEFRGADVTEENVVGQGILVGAFLRARDEEEDVGVRVFTPRIFGTRTNVAVEAGRTRSGSFFDEAVTYPFVAEIGRIAFRERFGRRDELFPYSVADGGDFAHVLLPVVEQRIEATFLGRIGKPGDLTVIGLGLSNATLDFPDFPDGLEVTDGDFDDTDGAPPELEAAIRPQTRHAEATRVNLLLGQRNLRFMQRRGLDAIRGVQDVAVGTEVALTIGRSVGAFSTGSGLPSDLVTRLRLFGGAAPGDVTTNVSVGLEGRRILSEGAADGPREGWRDVIGEVDALLYWQPPGASGHTLFARVAAAGGWEMTLPFQLTLGGPQGVRGFREETFPGGRRLVLTVEDRVAMSWPFPELFDFGFTLFADAGRVWDGDVPFGIDSGWKTTVGAGLRVGFPTGTRGVVRLDLGFPLGPEGSGPIFRVSMDDLIGLVGGVRDRQLNRSRIFDIGPDRFTLQSR